MPPRLSGVRVMHVATGPGGKPKPMNPGPAVVPAVAKRQKISRDKAKERVRNMRSGY